MKKPFIHDDFLLTTPAARELYHGYAESQPIIDYHCHLPPKEIAEDKRWGDMTEVWLGGDHYKWRQMRSNGVDERLITGDAPAYDKFAAFAATMERLVGNPLFDWSHLELTRYFGVTERLCSESAARIWQACNRKLATKGFSARGLMKKSNVEVVVTTDDPTDNLEYHAAIAKKPFGTRVLPAWRSDKASKIEDGAAWNAWMDKLGGTAKMSIKTMDDFRAALAKRHAFFAKNGCVISDYGIAELYFVPYTEAELARIFKKARQGGKVSLEEQAKFKSAWLYEGLKADAEADWSTQLHMNCLRNPNTKMFATLGLDTGFDCIGEWSLTLPLARLLDKLEQTCGVPRMVLYSLNPKDMEMLATLMGSFQKGPERGRIQLGAAWWFLDQKNGMRHQLDALAALGSLGNFVGMLTDSRSFLSYTRHEYFRRLLCQKLGEEVARGELPNDLKWLGGIVTDISYTNPSHFFFK